MYVCMYLCMSCVNLKMGREVEGQLPCPAMTKLNEAVFDTLLRPLQHSLNSGPSPAHQLEQ